MGVKAGQNVGVSFQDDYTMTLLLDSYLTIRLDLQQFSIYSFGSL